MTKQMTAKQLAALRATLARYGLGVTVKRSGGNSSKAAVAAVDDLAARIARVRGMKFNTAAVKTSILRSLTLAKASRDFHAAHPGELDVILKHFGVWLSDVEPWAGERWQCLVNGLAKSTQRQMLLPAPRDDSPTYRGFPDGYREVQADAASPIKRIVCS